MNTVPAPSMISLSSSGHGIRAASRGRVVPFAVETAPTKVGLAGGALGLFKVKTAPTKACLGGGFGAIRGPDRSHEGPPLEGVVGVIRSRGRSYESLPGSWKLWIYPTVGVPYGLRVTGGSGLDREFSRAGQPTAEGC